jgi:hypothetical protein
LDSTVELVTEVVAASAELVKNAGLRRRGKNNEALILVDTLGLLLAVVVDP